MTDSFYGCLLNRQRTTLASSSIVYGGTLSLLLAGTYSIVHTVTLTLTETVMAFYYLIINLTSKAESRQNFSTVFKQKILPAYPTFLVLFVGVVWLLQVDLIQRCFKYLQGLTGLSGCFMLISIYLELQYNNSTVVQLDCKKKKKRAGWQPVHFSSCLLPPPVWRSRLVGHSEAWSGFFHHRLSADVLLWGVWRPTCASNRRREVDAPELRQISSC